MLDVMVLLETTTKIQRQEHLDLSEPCLERGGGSTNHKGVLAQFLNTTIPYGSMAPLCHACNNGKCSNPRHLYWGTPKENNEDAIACGARPSRRGIPGHKHSIESRSKIAIALRGKPSNNKFGITGPKPVGYKPIRTTPQIWITDGMIQTRINFDAQVPNGWRRGRK